MNEVQWTRLVYLLFTIAVHVYCKETGAILLTPNKLEYTFFPFPSTSILKFKVRAPHNAHVLLSGGPKDENPTYEVFLGGWMNTKTALRLNHTRPDKAVASTMGILSAGELRGFWVNCSLGFVGIGREGEATPFLKWTNRRPFKVQYFGVRTSWGATGEWIIDDSYMTYARIDLYDFRIGLPGVVSVDVLSTTQPFLIWKVHNKTITEGGFDPTGRYHATKALFKKEGEWEAKLVISTVRLEDTQEGILMTARNRSKLGAKTYHVFLYAFNATSNYTDDLSGNEANESIPIDSSSLTDVQILWSTASSLESSNSNTESNNITQTKLIVGTTSTTSMELLLTPRKIMERTTRTPSQISTFSRRTHSPSIEYTITNSESISTAATITINKQNATTEVSRNIAEHVTKLKNNNLSSTSKPQEVSISYYTTTLFRNFTKQTRLLLSETKKYKIQKLSTKMTKSTVVTRMPTTTTAMEQLPLQKLQCSYYVNGAKYFGTVGGLVLVLALITALVAYVMIKHKTMTGQWGFTAKCQPPIPMTNVYDDDCCLIQGPGPINSL